MSSKLLEYIQSKLYVPDIVNNGYPNRLEGPYWSRAVATENSENIYIDVQGQVPSQILVGDPNNGYDVYDFYDFSADPRSIIRNETNYITESSSNYTHYETRKADILLESVIVNATTKECSYLVKIPKKKLAINDFIWFDSIISASYRRQDQGQWIDGFSVRAGFHLYGTDGSQQGIQKIRLSDPSFFNAAPTITLTTPNNQTLYENSAFLLNGTTTDANNGDALTVKYQIDSGAVRNLHSAISDGVTPIPFSKSLSYKDGVLKDGATNVTSVLSEGTPHVISVWAEDGNGGKSAVESRTFYVVPNRPPTLTVDPIAAQSELINSNVIPVNGTVGDLDGNDVVVTFQINDKEPVECHNGAPGVFAFNLMLKDLRTGSNTILLRAVDTYGAEIVLVLKFNKTHNAVPVNKAVALYKINPPVGNAQKLLLWIERLLGDLAITTEVSMTNDGEPENFVPLPRISTAPKNELGLQEDEFYYDALATKTNIIVKVTYTRTSSSALETIKKISGVLN